MSSSDIDEWRAYRKTEKEAVSAFRDAKAEAEANYLFRLGMLQATLDEKRQKAQGKMERAKEKAQDRLVATVDLAWKAYIYARIRKAMKR